MELGLLTYASALKRWLRWLALQQLSNCQAPGAPAIRSTVWFGDFGPVSILSLAPKVPPLISPAATPWETRSPTHNPSPERASQPSFALAGRA